MASDSRWRERFTDPKRILQGAKVKAGQTVLEVGCGQGFFTLPAAGVLGPAGRLYALDVTAAAVEHVARKVAAAGVANVRPVKADALATGLPAEAMDLVLLFGVVPSPTLPSFPASARDVACVEAGRDLGGVDSCPGLVAGLGE